MIGLPHINPVLNYDPSSVILRANFTSSAATDDGISFGTEQSGGSPAYSASGADFSGVRPVRFNLASNRPNDYEKLINGGRISFTVETAALVESLQPASDKYYISKTNGWIAKDVSGRVELKLPQESGLSPNVPDFWVSDTEKATRSTVVVAWDATNQYLFVDGLCISCTGAQVSSSEWSDFYVGGLTATSDSWVGAFNISDVVLSTEPFTYQAHQTHGRVAYFGDSFMTQGAIDSRMPPEANIPWDPGYGFQSSGAAATGGISDGDVGFICEFNRYLANQGLFVTGDNHAQSGNRIATTAQRVQEYFKSGNPTDIAVVGIGTNDVAALTPGNEFNANLQSIINSCLSSGVKRVVFWTIPSLRNNATYQTEAYNAKTAELNEYIKGATNHNRKLEHVDLFTLLGGHSFDSADFQNSDIHPSEQGSTKMGAWMGEKVIEAVEKYDYVGGTSR